MHRPKRAKMQYIEAPLEDKPKYPSVFLAGGITNCPNWQTQVCNRLRNHEITVFNPRRESFSMGNPAEASRQVWWEFYKLHRADLVSFWFSEGSLNPLALFELGAALERHNQMVLVGASPRYERRADVIYQTFLHRPNIYVDPTQVSSLDALAFFIRDILLYKTRDFVLSRGEHAGHFHQNKIPDPWRAQ